MTDIPVLETPRLILRPHALADYDDFHDLWADEEVVRYIGGKPSTAEASWIRLMNRAGMWHYMHFGFLIIEERESGRLIGEAGFHEVRRQMTPSLVGTLETGWLLRPDCQGKGYAFEAMTALIAWAEERFAERPMTAIIAPENVPSLALADRLGFREIARTDYYGPVIVLSRDVASDGRANMAKI